MDYRRWCWWAEWGVVAAVMGLHGLVFACPDETASSRFMPMTWAHDAQALAVAALMLGWGILGPGRLAVRVLGAAVLIPVWFFVVMQPRSVPAESVATVFCAAALILAGIRLCGFRVARSAEHYGRERGAQFSLLSLMVLITVVGLVVGLLEALRPTLDAFPDANFGAVAPSERRVAYQVREIVLAMAVALTSVGGLWVVLRPRMMWLRLVAAVAVIPATGVYLSHLSGEVGDGFVAMAMNLSIALLAVAGLCGVTVLPLRMMGFRLSRKETGSRIESVATSQLPVARILAGEAR